MRHKKSLMSKSLLCLILLMFTLFSASQEDTSTSRVSQAESQASKTGPKTLDPTPNRVQVNAPLPEDFQSLVEYRRRLLAKRDSLESELENWQYEFSLYQSSLTNYLGLKSDYERYLQQDQNRIDILKAIDSPTPEELQEIQQLEQYIYDSKRNLEYLERDKQKAEEFQLKIQKTELLLDQNDNEIAPVEQKIANLLNIEEERNSFRTWISIAFCILVAIVIIGFYVIALKKEEIAESIFAGEKGIQFVTIFLIVIAIILFGIMGILESKELSALLGGLSGYILGRVGSATDSKAAAARHPPHPS